MSEQELGELLLSGSSHRFDSGDWQRMREALHRAYCLGIEVVAEVKRLTAEVGRLMQSANTLGAMKEDLTAEVAREKARADGAEGERDAAWACYRKASAMREETLAELAAAKARGDGLFATLGTEQRAGFEMLAALQSATADRDRLAGELADARREIEDARATATQALDHASRAIRVGERVLAERDALRTEVAGLRRVRDAAHAERWSVRCLVACRHDVGRDVVTQRLPPECAHGQLLDALDALGPPETWPCPPATPGVDDRRDDSVPREEVCPAASPEAPCPNCGYAGCNLCGRVTPPTKDA